MKEDMFFLSNGGIEVPLRSDSLTGIKESNQVQVSVQLPLQNNMLIFKITPRRDD